MAAEKNDTRQWFLRIAGGTVFGPVPTKGLQVWAEQGRVAPGNEVSTDRATWLVAESVPELEMTWYLEDPSGSLVGPFHHHAAETLIKEGRAAADARLVAAADADLSRLRKPAEGAARKPAARDEHPELPLASAAESAAAGDAPSQEERESLRLRVAEQEEQIRQLLRAAEKEAKAHARQQEAGRRQVSQLQRELEEARQMPSPAVIPEGEEPDGPDAAQQVAALEEALDEARREAAATLQAAEREADALRARLAELEGTPPDARPAAADEAAPLRARVAELEATAAGAADLRAQVAELASAAEEAAPLRARVAELEAATAEAADLRAQVAELAAAANEAAPLRARVAELEAATATAQAALEEARGAYAELLDFANTRDSEQAAQVTALQADLAALQAEQVALRSQAAASEARAVQAEATPPPEPGVVREASARLREGEDLLAGLLAEEVAALDLLLETERDAFKQSRDVSLKRQELLQARLASLHKLQGGDTVGVLQRQVDNRTAKAETGRLRESLEALRQQHERHVRQADERERELVVRVRVLETEEERLKSQLSETDSLHRRVQDLGVMVREREQELAQERRRRATDQEQFQQAQVGLVSRIELLEAARGRLAIDDTPPADGADAPSADGARPEAGAAPRSSRLFRVTPWMQLK